MSGDLLALGAVGMLAVAGAVASTRKGAGSRTVNAYQGLRQWTEGHYGDLADYYPETAAGQHQGSQHEEVFWSGSGRSRYGVLGPTDGTMVPIEARYLEPMPGNIWDFDKLAALTRAIEQGDEPIVDSGYAVMDVVMNRGAVKQSEQSADDIRMQSFADPYENEDVGALTAMVRDGNHRSFAGLIAGADTAWVRLSDSDNQDLFERRGNRRIDRIYTEIRKAQRAHGAPVFTRPRLRRSKRTAELDTVEARHGFLKGEEKRLQRLLFQRYEHLSPELSAHDPLERPDLFLSLLYGRIQKKIGFDRLYAMTEKDADWQRLDGVEKERSALSNKLWALRQAAGLDWRTGEREYR